MTGYDLLLHRRMMMVIGMAGSHTHPDMPGIPDIETDPDTGDIISYENTEEMTVTTAGTSVDTEFIPFDGTDWTMHIYAHFQYSEQTETYPTLLSCMQTSSPWPGITIRYESSQLYIICNDSSGNKHYYTISADSSGNVDITMTYTNNTITIVNNSTTVASSVSLSVSLSDLSLTLLADVGDSGPQRYGIGTIYEFSIKKT